MAELALTPCERIAHAMFSAGRENVEVAATLDMSECEALRWRREMGFTIGPKGEAHRPRGCVPRLTPEQEAEMCGLFCGGVRVERLALMYDCSPTTIWRHLPAHVKDGRQHWSKGMRRRFERARDAMNAAYSRGEKTPGGGCRRSNGGRGAMPQWRRREPNAQDHSQTLTAVVPLHPHLAGPAPGAVLEALTVEAQASLSVGYPRAGTLTGGEHVQLEDVVR